MGKQAGFTLVEIAIVLVIVGLILGGVLKGQEMISNARVRSVIDQTTAIQTAVYAFQDRFRALPGDYLTAQATANLVGVTAGGNGNGRVDTNAERGLFWQHLGAAGFVTGSFDGAAVNANLACVTASCPSNPFGGTMIYSYGNAGFGATTQTHELRIGRNIPVNILAEIDRKIDDGIPGQGSFRADTAQNAATCYTGTGANSTYQVSTEQQDCAGVRRN
jgi:prepilin-type N-terminal cleavage/methylation domain-containing protein